jgi:hypothetical protein
MNQLFAMKKAQQEAKAKAEAAAAAAAASTASGDAASTTTVDANSGWVAASNTSTRHSAVVKRIQTGIQTIQPTLRACASESS